MHVGAVWDLGGHLGVSKNRGVSPKMNGEYNGKPYFLMDDLGVPLFSETSIWTLDVHDR